MAVVGRWNLQDPLTGDNLPATAEVGPDGTYRTNNVSHVTTGGPGGRYLGAANFGGNYGRMEIPASVSVGDEFSFAVWVKEDGQINSTIIGRYIDNANFVSLKAIQASPASDIRRQLHYRNNGEDPTKRLRVDAPMSGWRHYAITVTDTIAILYIDGDQADSLSLNAVTPVPSLTGNIWIVGSDLDNIFSDSSVGDWNGLMAGVAIFDHALTPSQVDEEYRIAKPLFIVAPSISGELTLGEVLQAQFTESDGTPSYQWLRDDSVIPGQESNSYTVVEADLLSKISVRVTLTNAVGWTPSTSPPVEASTPTSILDRDFGFAKDGDMLLRRDGKWQVTRDRPINVSDMPGNNFNEQFDAARERLADYHGAKVIQLPDGTVNLAEGIVLADPSTPPGSSNNLLHQVTIRGGRNTILFWDENPIHDSTREIMFDIPAAYQMRLESFRMINARRSDTLLTPLENKIGIYHHAAWEWNTNSARGSVFDSLRIERFDTGLYVGSPAGPDITAVSWNNCIFSENITGVVAEGANVAGYVFNNCQIGTTIKDGVAWRLKYSLNKYFDGGSNRPQYKDVWGDNKSRLDLPDTEEFQKRLIGPENDKHTIGGGPDIVIRDCNVTLGYKPESSSNELPTAQYALVSESASVYVDNLRVEGPHSAVLKTEPLSSDLSNPQNSNFANFHDFRFRIVMREVNCSGDQIPYNLAGDDQRLAGYPIEIIGGYYTNDYLPSSERKARRLITRTGDIRSPVVLSAENPNLLLSYQMDGAQLPITTLDDSSGNDHHLTVVGTASELVTGMTGQGSALDLKGTDYAELSATASDACLNGMNRGTISLRFKINSLANQDERFAGLISRRSVDDTGWALTLTNYNGVNGLRLRHDDLAAPASLSETTELQVGDWYHLAVVMIGDGTASFWLNGQKLNGAGFDFPTSAEGQPLRIGVDGAFLSRKFNGLLDDIRIYGEPLGIHRLMLLLDE
ncbi:MAG: LamG-like jellyroll fold domain-containing protein [Planctomycetota bacterium]